MGSAQSGGDRVLDAVFLLLTRSGYGGFSMADVARVADVAESAVTRRGSRAELVVAALDRSVPLIPACPDTGSWRGDLLVVVHWQIDVLSKYGGVVAQSFRATQDSEEYVAVARPARDRRMSIYRPMFERAIARGELDPDLDFDSSVHLVFGQVYGRYLGGRPVALADAEAIVDLVLQGLSARSHVRG
jgi:AcrR family transcriptional regulator